MHLGSIVMHQQPIKIEYYSIISKASNPSRPKGPDLPNFQYMKKIGGSGML